MLDEDQLPLMFLPLPPREMFLLHRLPWLIYTVHRVAGRYGVLGTRYRHAYPTAIGFNRCRLVENRVFVVE